MNRDHARKVIDFQELRMRVPLMAVLAHYQIDNTLRKSGRQLVGPCPIHGGSNKRQFVVKPETNEWHCFGDCDRGGATLEFVAAMERMSLVDAGRMIARWFALPVGSPSNQHFQRRKAMSGERPSHKAFVVEEREEGSDEKPFWTRIGSAWPHTDGKGWNIQLASGIAVSGRVVLREFTEADAEEDKKVSRFKKK